MANKLYLFKDGVAQLVVGTNDNDSLFWSTSLGEWIVAAGGGGGGGSGTVTSVTLDTGSTGLTVSGNTSKTITTSGTFSIAGLLGAGYGGTGLASVGTAGNFLRSTGTAWESAILASYAVTALTAVSNGGVILSGGSTGAITISVGQSVATTASPSFAGLSLTTTALGVVSGGTGLKTIAAGSILYASALDTLVAGTLNNLDWTNVVAPAGIYLRTGTIADIGQDFQIDVGQGGLENGAITLGTNFARLIDIGRHGITTTIYGAIALENALGTTYGGLGIDASGATDGELAIGQSTGSFAMHVLSVDATMLKTGAVKVRGLQNRAVADVDPTGGQTLVWSTSDLGSWVPGGQATGGSGGGGVVYYMNAGTAVSDGILPASTYRLGRTAETGSNPISANGVLTTQWTRVAGFVSDALDPSLTNIPAGIWDFNTWASSTANANQMYFRLLFYSYDGVTDPELGTAIATSASTYIFDPNVTTQYTASFSLPQTAFTGKRIYIRLEARAVSASKNVTFNFGNGESSHVHSTVPSVTGSGFVKVLNDVIVGTGKTIDLASSSDVGTSILGAANGGTGVASLTNHALLVGQGNTSPVAFLLGSAAGEVPRWSGTAWANSKLSTSDITGIGSYLLAATAALTYQTQAGMVYYAPLDSPTFTGDPARITSLAASDSTKKLATTEFVKGQGYLTAVPKQPYDIRGKFGGTPVTGTVIDSFVAARDTVINKADAHQFYCDGLPTSGNTVTIQVTRKKISDGTTVNIFQAVYTNTSQARSNNGLYAATSITQQNDTTVLAGDRVTFTYAFSGGAAEAAFSTPEWTVVATA